MQIIVFALFVFLHYNICIVSPGILLIVIMIIIGANHYNICIVRHGEQLQQLSIGNSVQILPDYLQQEVSHQNHQHNRHYQRHQHQHCIHHHYHLGCHHHHHNDHFHQGTFSDSEDDGVGGNVYQRQGFIIRAPNLK